MVWYNYLYGEERLLRKKEKIKWKVRHNAGQLNLYVISLSHGDSNLLEIISTVELMQKYYPKEHMFIVGLSRGYEQACALAGRIVMEVYEETGGFDVKSYLKKRHLAGNGRVSLCP